MEVGLVVQAAPAVILDLLQVVLHHISNFVISVTVMSCLFVLMFSEAFYLFFFICMIIADSDSDNSSASGSDVGN
jgi:hypothetical protein